jgi:hypothetical protein
LNQSKIIEYDNAGVKAGKIGGPALGLFCLANGHRIAGSYQDRTSWNMKGEVWRMDDLPKLMGAAADNATPPGDTRCHAGMKSPRRRLEGGARRSTAHARRLEDGRTLVSLQQHQKVVEADEEGKPPGSFPSMECPSPTALLPAPRSSAIAGG